MIKEPTNYVEKYLHENRLPISWLAYKLGMLPQTLGYKIRKRTNEELLYQFSVIEYMELLEIMNGKRK